MSTLSKLIFRHSTSTDEHSFMPSQKQIRILNDMRKHPNSTGGDIAMRLGYPGQPYINSDLNVLLKMNLLKRNNSRPALYSIGAENAGPGSAGFSALPQGVTGVPRTERNLSKKPTKTKSNINNNVTSGPDFCEIKKAIQDFQRAAKLAGIQIKNNDIELTYLGAPHNPNSLGKNKMGVYVFKHGKKYLKIGKAGPRSNPRFQSQHYGTKARSTLAKSLSKCADFKQLIDGNAGEWIRTNLDRIEIQLDQRLRMHVLALLEVFLHCCFDPKFEGKEGVIQTEE